MKSSGIQVIKGNPTEVELSALAAALEQLAAARRPQPAAAPNLWGRPTPRRISDPIFNPNAYRHVLGS